MLTTEKPPARKRDAEATKLAILEAARSSFAQAGYDQVGLREIAAGAGVDVALVSRYFGSKEDLFAAAISAGRPGIRDEAPPVERSRFGEWLARILVERGPKDPTYFLMVQHSVANPRAAAIIRSFIVERFIGPTATFLGGSDAELRASLMLAQISGFNMMARGLALPQIADADREKIIRCLGRAIQTYVDDPAPIDGPSIL